MNDERKRGFAIKPEKLALINKKVTEKGYSHEKLAELTQLETSTISKTLCGKNKPQRKTIEAIAQALDIDATDIVDANELYDKSQTVVQEQISPDWCLVCSKMLEKQQETQRLRSKATEMGFELNIYVPLGLVERKHQQRRTGNIEAKQLNQLEPEVITKTYRHDEFLQRFTEQNQGSKNIHTAIIGEAGAGKTTLLSKIASHIEENTENLFVFISLSNLEGQNLHEYLLNQWLCEAIGVSYPELDITPEIENKFIKRFRQGSVWLLLDGVDEMQNTTPLHSIESQLKDWLNQVRVVLTCRNNVWDASVNNGMTGFDTFKAQDLEPEQVNEFIENWFDSADDKQKGDLLKAKLQESGRERIRDLVRNPLSLSLLCQTFYVNKADLPETKAALYKLFILYFQEWKQHLYPIDRETQHKLYEALGKLALAGINSETKFRFRESVARQQMGNSLFELACDVNWLHQVDRDTQTDESVFAFFHPNFQEYFAALAINDNNWHYFLNHIPHNPEQGTYRIFEKQWKEVFLLWLGRENIANKYKNNLIKKLLEFQDGCGSEKFYWYKAYFLASAGIGEFKNFKLADNIIEQILEWSINGCIYTDIEWEAKAAIIDTDYSKVNKFLIKEIESNLDELDRWTINHFISIVEKIYIDDKKTLNSLYKKLSYLSNTSANKKNLNISLLETASNADEQNASKVGNVSQNTQDTQEECINELIKVLYNNSDEYTRWGAIEQIGEIGVGNSNAIEVLTLLLNDSNENIALQSASTLAKIDPGNLEAIRTLIGSLKERYYSNWGEASEGEAIRSTATQILGKIAFGNTEAIQALINLFYQTYITEMTHDFAVQSLINITPHNLLPLLVSSLKECYYHQQECFQVFWHCINNMSYSDFYMAWHGSYSIKRLENQFIDIASQLNSTHNTYIYIDANKMALNRDENIVSKLICTKIFKILSLPVNEIPKISDVADLQLALIKLTENLQKKSLLLLFDKCKPTEVLLNICHTLVDAKEINIAWITDEPLEAPLRGFPPNQPNLLNAIQSWVNEIE